MARLSVQNFTPNVPISPTYGKVPYVDLKRFTDLNGVTVTGVGATFSIESIDGYDCLKIVTGIGNTAEVEIATSIAPPIVGHFLFNAYVVNAETIDLFIARVSKNNYAGWAQMNAEVSPATPSSFTTRSFNGWHGVTMSQRTKLDSGTGNDFRTETTDKVNLSVVPFPGQQSIVYLYSFSLVARTRPKFILSYDDNLSQVVVPSANITLRGVAGTYSAKDILEAYGFKGTLYVVGELIETQAEGPSLTWAQIKELQNREWSIAYQIYRNCASSLNYGARLLGSFGYSPKTVFSVDVVANTITCLEEHYIITGYGYPVEFIGMDLPSPLLRSVKYWARPTSITGFTLHPTELDSRNNTNSIDLTTEGVAANFSWRYWGSSEGYVAILSDLEVLKNKAVENNVVLTKHVAPNQSGMDVDVYAAYKAYGMKTVRTTVSMTNSALSFVPYDAFIPKPKVLTMCEFYDNSRTQEQVIAAVDAVISDGTVGFAYAHNCNNISGQNMAWLCDYLSLKKNQGLIDVVTIDEWYMGL